MTTVTDAATDATNVDGDRHPETTGLPTPTVTSVVNLVATPAVLEGPLNHYKRPKKFIGVNFKRWQ
ncbi:hypothetical protein CsSME_00040172 [Camellia sinensis var. sinensis]